MQKQVEVVAFGLQVAGVWMVVCFVPSLSGASTETLTFSISNLNCYGYIRVAYMGDVAAGAAP